MGGTNSSLPLLTDNSGAWGKNPNGIGLSLSLGKDRALFSSVEEAIAYGLGVKGITKSGVFKSGDDNMDEFIKNIPANLKSLSNADSSTGGSTVINPMWAFNEDDDINLNVDIAQTTNPGMGLAYKEMYYDNQQILYLSFGTPQYRGLADFYSDVIDPKLATLMNRGERSFVDYLGSIIGTGLRLAWEIPFLPFTVVKKIGEFLQAIPITKYYEFKPAMPLYYEMVNSILSYLAVSQGLWDNGLPGKNPSGDAVNKQFSIGEEGKLPKILADGPDIYAIIDRIAQSRRSSASGVADRRSSHADVLKKMQSQQKSTGKKGPDGPYAKSVTDDSKQGEITLNKRPGFFGKIWNSEADVSGSIMAHATEGSDYIGFRIDKGGDTSESVSNSTGESDIAQTVNSKVTEARSKAFNFGGFKTGIGMVDGLVEGAKDAVTGILSGFGPIGDMVSIATGNAFVEFPEVWKDSSFSKSYSFNIKLNARYGDPISKFQCLDVPLSMILAGALPRGTGANSYTGPFICRAYCKGMFSVPLGIIESVNITRGLAEHGWTQEFKPTAIDVSLTIKDLSPALFMTLAGNGISSFKNAFSGNTGMHEYLSTLSGLGVAEMTFGWRKTRRRLAAASLVSRNTTFSSTYWKYKVGTNTLTRVAAEFSNTWATDGL